MGNTKILDQILITKNSILSRNKHSKPELYEKLKALPRANIRKTRNRWSLQEHEQFIELIRKHGKEWRYHAEEMIPTKDFLQTQWHYELIKRKAMIYPNHPISPLLLENFYIRGPRLNDEKFIVK